VIAVVAGSFDPITIGHRDLIERAGRLFDQVVVGVGRNSSKDYLFSPDERLALVEAACADLGNVRVEPMTGLLVDFCADHGATVVVRGARSGGDFDQELAMAAMNRSLAGVETVVLPARADIGFVSSTLVRSVIRASGPVEAYVPATVAGRIRGKKER